MPVNAFLQLFWQLCLFRIGPERVPTFGTFVLVVAFVNIAISALAGIVGPLAERPGAAFALPVLHAAVIGAGTWLVLLAKGLHQRFTATFVALLGTDAMITTLSLPLSAFLRPSEAPTVIDLFASLAQLGLFVWWITVAGHVFARALDIARGQGIAVASFVMLTSLIFNYSVIPPPIEPASFDRPEAQTDQAELIQ